jgi:hypothetical protein
MLGRGHVRREPALPEGRPMGAPAQAAHGDAQPAAADAAARIECGRLHQLRRQRGEALRAAGGA